MKTEYNGFTVADQFCYSRKFLTIESNINFCTMKISMSWVFFHPTVSTLNMRAPKSSIHLECETRDRGAVGSSLTDRGVTHNATYYKIAWKISQVAKS